MGEIKERTKENLPTFASSSPSLTLFCLGDNRGG
ncbi:MAG: hypothetical protein MRERV_46c008 [Mycoplasmataceae bacterium RV_VA103A]|nr:MAG: hypothetical protein MRERV_46c008 [Mycoplasmataceae bacterium RV_VA103A]